MRRDFPAHAVIALTLLGVSLVDTALTAADIQRFEFEVRETAGIRRRNDVITIRTDDPAVVGHTGGFRILSNEEPIPAQVRRVDSPGEPQELVIDFIDHFQPHEGRRYSLELLDGPTPDEPTGGLTLTETADAYRIDSGGVVIWTIRKDLAGLLDFTWKDTDYIADDSPGLYFMYSGNGRVPLADRRPTRVSIERQGPLAVSLRFDYDNWPEGAQTRVQLEFPRTKSWIHATWTISGMPVFPQTMGAALNLRLDGPEVLLDFGAGDFVYATVTKEQAARLEAGPSFGSSVPWQVLHGRAGAIEPIFVAPQLLPTPPVHGWAHVMDDKRATALAISQFGEHAKDAIDVQGNGQLSWSRTYNDSGNFRTLEFWLHFVTMPVHIGARTSPRSMQEPLEVEWLSQ